MVKKAHFVTGKGGVGKSLVAALLARSLSLKSQHVLLAELSETSFYEDYLDLKTIGYQPTPWLKNIDICQWSGTECLKEYALHLLKIKKLYELLPALYRIRDTELGIRLLTPSERLAIKTATGDANSFPDEYINGPLKSLLTIIAEQVSGAWPM